jgi:hypothetical protein
MSGNTKTWPATAAAVKRREGDCGSDELLVNGGAYGSSVTGLIASARSRKTSPRTPRRREKRLGERSARTRTNSCSPRGFPRGPSWRPCSPDRIQHGAGSRATARNSPAPKTWTAYTPSVWSAPSTYPNACGWRASRDLNPPSGSGARSSSTGMPFCRNTVLSAPPSVQRGDARARRAEHDANVHAGVDTPAEDGALAHAPEREDRQAWRRHRRRRTATWGWRASPL